MSEGSTPQTNAPDNELASWLTKQATRLKTLEGKGRRLRLDFVQNSKEKGEILSEVKRRLQNTGMSLKAWVEESTDIGYSTALLYMDVADHFDDVKKRFADSNGLELTLRQFREAIRDARQERGEGKPGSGRSQPSPSSNLEQGQPTAGEGETVIPSESEEANGTDEDDAPDEARWEREVSKAEAEAAGVEDGSESSPEASLYKVTVLAFADADQEAMYQALLKWSPVRKTSIGTKHIRSVSAGVRTTDIAILLDKLGKALEENRPQKVRVSIEL